MLLLLFTSPFKNSDILTIDGHGEVDTCYFGYGKNKIIKNLDSIKYPHSVGLFYGAFTNFLGFKPDSDEWKAMALSSYKFKSQNIYLSKIKKIFKLHNGKFELDLSYFQFYFFDRKKNFFTKNLKSCLENLGKKIKKLKKDIMKLPQQCKKHLKRSYFTF